MTRNEAFAKYGRVISTLRSAGFRDGYILGVLGVDIEPGAAVVGRCYHQIVDDVRDETRHGRRR